MCPIFNKTSMVCWNLSQHSKQENQQKISAISEGNKAYIGTLKMKKRLKIYIQRGCRHHILDGISPYNKLCEKGSSQTLRTIKENMLCVNFEGYLQSKE